MFIGHGKTNFEQVAPKSFDEVYGEVGVDGFLFGLKLINERLKTQKHVH